MMEIVIFDTETTGLLKPDNAPIEDQPKITEFYGVRINEDFEILSEVDTFINPGEPLTKEITRITGIKDSDVENAPVFGEVADKIDALFKGADLSIAHNIAFDNGMLRAEFARIAQIPVRAKRDLCTVDHLKSYYGHRINLSNLYFKMYGKYFKAHRAKSDVNALVACVHALREKGVINFDEFR
jgi:DNA polymerase III epsilon subunit-like protein